MAKEKSLKSLIYATFKDDVAFSIRDMKQYIRNGGILNYAEITAILDKHYVNLAYELDENGIDDPETILDRAEQYLESATIKFVEIPLYADVIEEKDDDDDSINIPEGYISIGGIEYAIVDSNDYFTLKKMGIERRGRTITSFRELEEYVNAIPAVYGIELVYNVSGTITGYRVWVANRTD